MNRPVDEACNHSDSQATHAAESLQSCGHNHGHSCNHEHVDAVKLSSGRANGEHVPETFLSRVVGFMDIAGVAASTICTIHCLLVPILVLSLPVFAKHMMDHDIVHVALAGFVLTFCLIAFIPGYLTHKDKRLLYLGAMGVSLVFFATFVARTWGEAAEAAIITAGNALIICGHMLNRKLLAHLKCKHKH